MHQMLIVTLTPISPISQRYTSDVNFYSDPDLLGSDAGQEHTTT